MDVGRPQLAIKEHGNGLVGGGEDLQPGDNSRRIDEGILEGGVAGEELRLEKARVRDVLEKGYVNRVRRGHMLQGDRIQHRHFVN